MPTNSLPKAQAPLIHVPLEAEDTSSRDLPGGDLQLQSDDDLALHERDPIWRSVASRRTCSSWPDSGGATASVRVDVNRRQEVEPVARTKCLLRPPRLPGELTNAHQVHGRIPRSGCSPGVTHLAAFPTIFTDGQTAITSGAA
jgi:hypothetical protein